MGQQFLLHRILGNKPGTYHHLVTPCLTHRNQLIIRWHTVAYDYGVNPKSRKMTRRQTRIHVAMSLHRWKALKQRTSPAIVAGDKSTYPDPCLVQHDGLTHKCFLAESCPGTRIEIMQSIYIIEVRIVIHECLQYLARHGGSIKLYADMLPVSAVFSDFFRAIPVIETKSPYSEHPKG